MVSDCPHIATRTQPWVPIGGGAPVLVTRCVTCHRSVHLPEPEEAA